MEALEFKLVNWEYDLGMTLQAEVTCALRAWLEVVYETKLKLTKKMGSDPNSLMMPDAEDLAKFLKSWQPSDVDQKNMQYHLDDVISQMERKHGLCEEDLDDEG